MSIHIGKVIKEAVKKSGISVTDFADQINYSRRNIYEIFDKETIDTGVLIKVNKVLNQNLFLHYISNEDLDQINLHESSIKDLKESIELLKNEIDRLKDVK